MHRLTVILPGSMIELAAKENGNVIVILALALSVLLGCTALAVDTGVLYLEHNRLVRAADAAALAGGQELPDASKALSVAFNYAQQNGIDTADPNFFTVSISPDNKKITVEIKKNVDLHFARVLGFNTSRVKGRAAANISPVKKTTGILPVGLDESLLPLAAGQTYIIKVGFPEVGWTGILEYPGQSGADDYRKSARYGYPNPVTVGDNENKAPGNVTGPTIQGIQERIDSSGDTWNNPLSDSQRVVVVPIYRVLGASPIDNVKVVGFASVFLEKVVGAGNKNEVFVTYINHTISGETDDTLTTSYVNSVRLVE